MKGADRKETSSNMDCDTKEEPEVIVLDEEDCPFTIITVKIGENGTIEETNEPVINLNPQMHPTFEQMHPTFEQMHPTYEQMHPTYEQMHPTYEQYEQMHPTYEEIHPKYEQADDSSETDNSDDWADDVESPVNAVPIQPKTKKKKRKKGPHMCPYCGKIFGQRLHLNDHIMTHTGEKPFKCLVCSRGFIQRSNLITHINQRHPSEAPLLKMHKITQSFNCWDCKRSFSTHHDYRKHMKAHTKALGEKQSSSFQLEDTSDINPSSDSDAQSNAAEITYSCAFCDQEYPDEESLALHMKCHTATQSPDTFICEDNPAGVNTKHQKKQERGEEPFSCKYCGKQFTTQLSLSYHERTHRIKRTFRCSICRRGFDKRQAYDRHIRKQCRTADQTELKIREQTGRCSNQQSAETFLCKYCGKQCDTKVSLSYHERTHRIQRTFRCSVCNRGFNRRQAFERHKTEHKTEEKTDEYSAPQSPQLLSCKYCGKQCPTDMSLSYHERTHKINRMFRCSICRRGFNSRQAYDRHVRVHPAKTAFQTERQEPEESGSEYSYQQRMKSFSCKYCGKRCTTEMNLSYHERTHKIKRTFRCSICKRGFYSRQAYDQHLTKHSSKSAVQTEHQKVEERGDEYSDQWNLKSFSCKYCGKQFNTKLSLSYHERTHKIQRTFRCPLCNRGFDSEQAYDRHIRNHKPAGQTEHQKEEASEISNPMNPESFNCKYCGKQCNTKISLSYHERTHRIKRTFCCHICRRGFDSTQAYDRHLRKHQKGEESVDRYSTQQRSKPFSCFDREARFSSEQTLLDDEKSHSNQRTFCCSVCNRGFNRRQTYDRHIKLHSAKSAVQTDQKKEETDECSVQQSPESFSCKYCGKQCNTKLRLSYHERTHKIKRTFCCSICNRGFNSKIVYDQHLRKHSSQNDVQTEPEKEESMDNHSKRDPLKVFSCDKCGVRFRQKRRLLNHMKYHTSDTPFCCKFCNKTFSTKAALVMHMKSYTVEMPFSCSVCDEKFKFPGRLAFHMRTHGIKDFKPYSCTACDKNFSSRNTLNLHKARFHKEGPLKSSLSRKDFGETFCKRLHLLHHESSHEKSFRCSVCKKGFNKRQAYDRHLRLHTAKPVMKTEPQKVEESGDRYSAQESPESFSCKDCGKRFSKKLNLEYHMRMHNIKFAFPCSICKKQFSRRQAYEEHVKMHSEEVGNTSSAGQISNEELQSNTGEIIFSCPLCDKELPTELGLKEHMDDHEKNDPLQPFSCVKCGARFQERQWLESHMEIHNVDRIVTFCCNICNKNFAEHSEYESHMRSHIGPRPSTEVCNKKISHGGKLEEPAQAHTGEKTVSCPVCLRKFSCSSSLKRHMPLHEGEDKLSLSCEDCGKQYSSKLGLFYHRRTHNIKIIRRTYRCSVCNMRFAKKLEYDWHVRMHCPKPTVKTEPQQGHGTSDPAFSCEYCGARFRDNVSWLYHKRTHKKNAFSCSVCKKGFGKREVYELHMKMHHKEAKESDLENKADVKRMIRHMESVGQPPSETAHTGLSL